MSGPPPDHSLLPQQFYWDTSASQGKIWAGVPGTDDPTGKVLVMDTATMSSPPPMAYAGTHSLTVQTTSGVLIAAGAYKTALTIQTLPGSTGNVWLRPDGSAAMPNTGILVQAYGGSRSFGAPGFPLPTGNITAITDGGAPQVVLVSGG